MPDLTLCYSATAVFAQGVGLGASKGKEVGKYPDGYAGYVHMAQDAVSHYATSVFTYSWLSRLVNAIIVE